MAFKNPNQMRNDPIERSLLEFKGSLRQNGADVYDKNLLHLIEKVKEYETALDTYEKKPMHENKIPVENACMYADNAKKNAGEITKPELDGRSMDYQRLFVYFYDKVRQLTDHWLAVAFKNGEKIYDFENNKIIFPFNDTKKDPRDNNPHPYDYEED